MNLRKLKRNVYARMWRDLFYGGPIGQFLGTFRHVTTTPLPDTVVIDDLTSLMEPVGKTYLNMQDIPVSVPIETQTSGLAKYVVVKKANGEVVGEFDHLEEAQAIIDKAKRAKKAVLVLLNEEPVV